SSFAILQNPHQSRNHCPLTFIKMHAPFSPGFSCSSSLTMGHDPIPQLLSLAIGPCAYLWDFIVQYSKELLRHNHTSDFTTMNQEQTRLDPALLKPGRSVRSGLKR
ncbi:MAG: hypothetical protein O7B35_04120, partial [Deltaproteobacteria bacterium]|nr:hypothetical protein [Deltaproteobacteria bacterium]